MMNNHLQPSYPATPSILEIAAAKRPGDRELDQSSAWWEKKKAERTSKSSSRSRSAEEDGGSNPELLSLEPLGKEVVDGREQATFGPAKKRGTEEREKGGGGRRGRGVSRRNRGAAEGSE